MKKMNKNLKRVNEEDTIMYGIKRNIKKFNTNGNIHQGIYVKSSGKGIYQFPYCGTVPGGIYFSEIKSVTMSKTRNGDAAIEVCYAMRNAYACEREVNGLPLCGVDDKMYYIKQKYPKGTQYCYDFIDAMAKTLNIKAGITFNMNNIVGVTELVKLEYGSSSIGGFTGRKPFEKEDFYDPSLHEEDEEEIVEQVSVQTQGQPTEDKVADTPKYNNDDDEDFDDFLDDDWDD